jgi:23S rRNA (cytosine1962-C5)-methyltransferase
LLKVYKQLNKIASKRGVTCYRLYNKDMPEHPLIIDVYGKHIVVYEYESKHKLTDEQYEEWFDNLVLIIKEILNVADENLHLKMRRRKRNREDQYQKLKDTKAFETVEEGGHSFLVNFNDFLDTGLFLDHRITRKMVQESASNKKVLNLFCYTGSFSIYAAQGGAAEVCSIDMSNTYIDWGKQNDALNSCAHLCKMEWIKADVLQEIKKLPSNYFDIIILDPPTFSNSKSMLDYWDVQEHHASLLMDLHALLSANGIIYFSNNYRGFVLNNLLENYFQVKDITRQTTDFDFEGKLERPCFLLTKKC